MSKTSASLSNYHITNSHTEIVDAMIRSTRANQTILWQTVNGQRTVYPVTGLSLDASRKMLTFTFSPSTSVISAAAPIYVKLAFRETVFKVSPTQTLAGQVVVTMPEEIHWRDLRVKKRLSFRRGERHVITRPYFAHLRSDQLPSLKVSLRDISERGVGVYISHQNVDFFKVGKFIELTALGEAGLPRPLLGHVMWVKRTETKSERDEGLEWLVGVKMLDMIPAPELNTLSAN